MIKKAFYIFNLTLALFLPIITLNLISSDSDPNTFFPFIFTALAFCETFVGIILLNSNKKALSISTFILASFFFIIVGAKICIYG